MNPNPIKDKSKAFAIRIVKLYKHLSEGHQEFVLSKQVLRCGTSIGANVSEAIYAISKPDFHSKMAIALKEASETEYWLELLRDTNYISEEEFDSLYGDCKQLIKLLASITKTAKSSLQKNDRR